MKYLTPLLLLIGWCITPAFGQHHEHSVHRHTHHHERNEIGLSGGAIYGLNHSDWGGGMHLHYFRTFTPHSKWSWGANLEYVWTHDNHFTIGAGVKYQILDRLSVGVLPGITFLNHKGHEEHDGHTHAHTEKKTLFSAHFEVVYDLFHWEKFHLGPAFDFSWAKGDSHLMIGVHAAFCF